METDSKTLKLELEYLKKAFKEQDERIEKKLDRILILLETKEKQDAEIRERLFIVETALFGTKNQDNDGLIMKVCGMEKQQDSLKPLMPAAKIAGGTGAFVTILAIVYFVLKITGKMP